MLTRRGILGALGATVAAGPYVAASVAQSAVGVTSNGIAGASTTGVGWSKISASSQALCGSIDGGSYADRLRRQIAEHVGMSRAEIRAQHEETLAEIAEADVMSLRSVSVRHKTQMIIERRIARAHARRGNWLTRELLQLEDQG